MLLIAISLRFKGFRPLFLMKHGQISINMNRRISIDGDLLFMYLEVLGRKKQLWKVDSVNIVVVAL